MYIYWAPILIQFLSLSFLIPSVHKIYIKKNSLMFVNYVSNPSGAFIFISYNVCDVNDISRYNVVKTTPSFY